MEEVAAEAKFGDELSAEQLGQVKEVLKEYHKQTIFSNQPGRTHLMQHHIKTGDAQPVRMPQ